MFPAWLPLHNFLWRAHVKRGPTLSLPHTHFERNPWVSRAPCRLSLVVCHVPPSRRLHLLKETSRDLGSAAAVSLTVHVTLAKSSASPVPSSLVYKMRTRTKGLPRTGSQLSRALLPPLVGVRLCKHEGVRGGTEALS